jgi:AraC family transcriptional activator of pobA
MNPSVEIPVLRPENSMDFHFESIEWLPLFSGVHHELFHINRLEDYRDKLKFPLPPHRKTVYDFVFLKRGFSKRSKGLNHYTFGAGEFFFLPPYQITTHELMSEDVEGYFCHFDAQLFGMGLFQTSLDNFSFLQFLSHPLVKVPLEAQKPILNSLERLESLYLQAQRNDLELISVYLLSLLLEVKKYVKGDTQSRQNSTAVHITQQFKNALMQEIYRKQTVVEYADLLSVTPNHLNKCVRAATHKTAQDLLNEMLILEAKSLLKYSNLQIAEIAVKLCNQTPSNFARFFKSQTGVSPKQYLQMD